jgi:DNA modification methylase
LNAVLKIIQGDSRTSLAQLPEKSIHCCITSVPYWGLRSYLPADHPLKPLEIGCETTFDLYLEHISEVFKAVHRVLRDDGTLWVNVGDAYASTSKGTGGHSEKQDTNTGSWFDGRRTQGIPEGYKSKDLLMMPARIAMRLQADGWYLRSMIPWIKRNAMPESVTDRPATACEYVFLLSKSQTYYYDRYAVMMKTSANTNARLSQDVMNQIGSERAHAGGKTNGRMKAVGGKVVMPDGCNKQNGSMEGALALTVTARNRRNSDWFMESFQGMLTDDAGEPMAMIVNPKGTSIKHFASYPKKLVAPIIQASTSEKGCCPICGTPWERITEASGGSIGAGSWTNHDEKDAERGMVQNQTEAKKLTGKSDYKVESKGWNPICDCEVPETEPCTVLDCFGGTGTTGEVAIELGRKAVICELNPIYTEFVNQRCDVTPGLRLA